MRIKIQTSWAGSNPCLNTFYFSYFLKKEGLHAVARCFFCNARWYRCGGGLQVTRLTTRRLGRSSEQGSQEIAPAESTRDVEYKERGGMW